MTLEKQDAELFYELWFPLLDFVNQKYRVCPGTGTIDRSRGVDAADAKKIADYLLSHTGASGIHCLARGCGIA